MEPSKPGPPHRVVLTLCLALLIHTLPTTIAHAGSSGQTQTVSNTERRVPLPDGAEITSRVAGSKTKGTDYVWRFRSEMPWKEVLAFYSKNLRAAGWERYTRMGEGCWRRDGRNDYEDIVCVRSLKTAKTYELRMSPPAPD